MKIFDKQTFSETQTTNDVILCEKNHILEI